MSPARRRRLLLLLVVLLLLATTTITTGQEWSYEEGTLDGPKRWAQLRQDSEWRMCRDGKLQSPVDIRPNELLYDPNLKPVRLDRAPVMSELVNTGQLTRVRLGHAARLPSANLTGGPLMGYRYRLLRVDIHHGTLDQPTGSEHAIGGRRFPMEIQLIGYNTDLYVNYSAAVRAPHGLVALAILVELGRDTNDELLKLTVATASVPFKGDRVELADFEPWRFLPTDSRDFVTYQGSLTAPGCHESVTWIVANRPIYITPQHLYEWARISKTSPGGDAPKLMAPNARPLQPVNGRLIRTNIVPRGTPTTTSSSLTDCEHTLSGLQYRVNQELVHKARGRRGAEKLDDDDDDDFDEE